MSGAPVNSEKQNEGLLKLFREATQRVPFLKYAWILIVSVCILSLAAFYNLEKKEVFIYAIAVILICYLGFVFSYFQRVADPFVKFFLRYLCGCIVLCTSGLILSVTSYLITTRPDLSAWFPLSKPLTKSPRKNPTSTPIDSDDKSDKVIQKNYKGVNVGHDQNNYTQPAQKKK